MPPSKNEYNINTYTIHISPSQMNITQTRISFTPPIHEWMQHSPSPIAQLNPQSHTCSYACSHIRSQCTFKLTCLMHISRSNYTCTVYTQIHIHAHTCVHTYVLNVHSGPCVSCTYHKKITSVNLKLTRTKLKWIISTTNWNLLGFYLSVSIKIDPIQHIKAPANHRDLGKGSIMTLAW